MWSCSTSYKGPPSDHFDGEVFFYPGFQKQNGFKEFLKWQRTRSTKPWPTFVSDVQQIKPKTPSPGTFQVYFISHATSLIQIDGLNILTDPVFSERASPVQFAGPRRVRLPGIHFNDLPKIDLVLVSHNHYDHLDLETLKKLYQRDRPRFFVPLGDQKLLEKNGISTAQELDWAQTVNLNETTTVTFEKALHWSSRGLTDRMQSLWGSYLITHQKTLIYFAGDTGYHTHFKELREKYGPIQVALLPIGAYEPRWFMKESHMNPADAVQAALDLQAEKSIGIHFGMFQLTDEGLEDPILDLAKALQEKNLAGPFFTAPKNGQEFVFPIKTN